MTSQKAYLEIEKGEPFEKNSMIQLLANEILLGRTSNSHVPDIVFTSLFISRSHAMISCSNGLFTLTDLNSKHGTRLNGNELKPGQTCLLRHGDRISLAKDTVVLVFNSLAEIESGETVEFGFAADSFTVAAKKGLVVNPDRREIIMDDKPLFLSGKDLDLLLLLYRNCKKAVSYNEIKSSVWPERLSNPVNNIPDVGSDEITALVYRLRKHLGRYGQCIVSVPRYGYMLDI